ncbi:MAG: type IV pilus secretin PilQ [Proteobacteria bacterium]|nr:type IV pilus secretin PilQ [Pseudomonadota bacterium]HQR05054.1 type IV pilus secretin PilQ [Rhodocyclaceae bacterium]
MNVKFLKYFLACLGAVLATLTWAAGVQGNAIEKVEFSELAGQTLVKVTLRSPLDRVPASFSVSNPPRLAFDFLDTENASGNSLQQAGVGNLRSVNLVQAANRTRLVLNLNQSTVFEPRIEGNALFIKLPAAMSMASAPSTATAPTLARMGGQPSSTIINSVDFQAKTTDLATIKIEVSDPNALLDARQQGNSLVLNFPSTGISERAERKLDVRDFGTPVTLLNSQRAGGGAQVAITNRGDWDYSVRQVDTSVVVEIRRAKSDPNNLAESKQLQGKVVSFNFTQPVPVSQMIGIFQDITGFNFMVMPGVGGEIQSLKMDNTPVGTAIDVISRMYGLGFRRYGDIVVVGRADDLAKYDKDERDRAAALASVDPIEQDSIKVRYRPASEIVQALMGQPVSTNNSNNASAGQGGGMPPPPGGGQPDIPQAGGNSNAPQASGGASKSMISARGSIAFDSVTNTIFVEETRAQLDKIRDRVSLLDRPVRQVMIEARIVSVSDNYARNLGARIGFLRNPNGATISGTAGTSPNGPQTISGGTMPAGQIVQASGGYDSSQGAKSTDLIFNLFNQNQTRILQLELSASETDNALKDVASPKILTQDGRQATITNGQNICFQLSGALTGPTTSCIDAATKLDVTPQINPDGKIQLKVYVNKGEPAANAGGVVTTNKREIRTQVVVENGGTLMLGGVFEDSATNNVDQVPLLGDIPVLGNLFKTTLKQRNRQELLIFITPRVVSEDLTLQ